MPEVPKAIPDLERHAGPCEEMREEMRRAAWAAAIAAATLFIRHTLTVLNEVRHEQAMQRRAQARAHHAQLHRNCRCFQEAN